MIGESPAFLKALMMAKRVAPFQIPVLITGETGSGKEGFARLLHDESGRKGPFIAFNCASFTGSIMDSQLFGYETGAFTGANKPSQGLWRAAEGGTLFLDEIGELPLDLQAKLLRTVESGAVTPVGGYMEVQTRVRLVTATHQPIRRWVEQGRFRRDLFARLSRYELHLPPIRERGNDIVLLAEHILKTSDVCKGMEISLTEEVRAAIVDLPWPENVRGIQNWLERLAIEGVQKVELAHLPFANEPVETAAPTHGFSQPSTDTRSTAKRVPEVELIMQVLTRRISASRAELEKALRLPDRSLQYLLPELVSQGLLVASGERRWLRYSLPPPPQMSLPL